MTASIAVIYFNRPLITKQRSASNSYHAARAAEAASGGLAWTLANLNGPKPTGRVCRSSGQIPWRAACQWIEKEGLVCDCFETDKDTGEAGLGLGFQVALSPVLSGASASWDVSIVGCSAPAGRGAAPCAAADGATLSTLEARLRFVPLLAHLPGVALTAGGTISSPLPTGAGEPAWGGYVMGAYLSTPSQEVAAEPSPALLTGARTASPRDKLLAVDPAALREVAYRLTCDGDCSGPIHRAVQRGHTVIWVDGDLSLASALTLGDDEHPVLLWVTGDVTLASRVSVTGLLLSRSVVWRATAGRDANFKGAMVVDGPITVTGSPTIEWAPEVLDRLAATSGWFEPVPGLPRVN